MRPCPNCGTEGIVFGRTVTDRRGTDEVAVQRGSCQHCGANVRRDTTTGEAVAFGPVVAADEADAVLELRRRAGARPTNFTHYCPVCDDSWTRNVDHAHELFVWPWEDAHDGKRIGGWCEHTRTETVEIAPDGTPTEGLETRDAEVVTMTAEKTQFATETQASADETVSEGDVVRSHRSITVDCRRVFEEPRQAAKHAYRTDHDVHIELLDRT